MGFDMREAAKIRSLCIGKFDGLHLGHQALLGLHTKDCGVLIILAYPPPYLTPRQEDLIALPLFRVGLEEVREMDCVGFALFLRQRFPSLNRVIVGYDFRFGKDRACGAKDLERFFEVCVVDAVRLDGVAVHRQAIFQALNQGEIQRANAMLGRPYSIKGRVIAGQGRGSKECVPTLNLRVQDYALPKSGVYASYTKMGGLSYESVSFIGHRLSSDGEFAIETHLLGDLEGMEWGGELGLELEIGFLEFLRENRKFSSLEELKAQIARDIARVKSAPIARTSRQARPT